MNAPNDRIPDGDGRPLADGLGGRLVDRRTLLLGAAGGLAAAGAWSPTRSEGFATSPAARRGRRLNPVLARRLQQVLHDALRAPSTHFPGAIPARRQPQARHLDGRRRPRSRGAGDSDAPGRPLRAGSVSEAVCLASWCSNSPSAAGCRSTPGSRGCCPPASSRASRPRPRSRSGCCSATAAGSRSGTPR